MTDITRRNGLALLIGVAALFVVALPLVALALGGGQTGGGMQGGMGGMGGMMGSSPAVWTGPLWLLWGVAVTALVGGGAVLAFEGSAASADADERAAGDAEDAIEALRERYVRDEISEAEFERRVEVLLGSEPDAPGRERGPGSEPGRESGREREPDRERAVDDERG